MPPSAVSTTFTLVIRDHFGSWLFSPRRSAGGPKKLLTTQHMMGTFKKVALSEQHADHYLRKLKVLDGIGVDINEQQAARGRVAPRGGGALAAIAVPRNTRPLHPTVATQQVTSP